MTGFTPRARFLTESDCHEIARRLARFARGGGYTTTTIVSRWHGTVRWARNEVHVASELRDNHVVVNRNLRGATNKFVHLNDISDAALVAGARRAERLAALEPEMPEFDLQLQYTPESYEAPDLFSKATYELSAEQRTAAARELMHAARDAGMWSAGYIDVSAHSMAFISSTGYARYFQYTWAQFSTTVRDPAGTGSGWAGVDWHDWSKIGGARLASVALDKCLSSRTPAVIEPGRYTTILEPQAVCDMVGGLMFDIAGVNPFAQGALTRLGNETTNGPFNKRPGLSKLGERVVDERLTISADPGDPEMGFPPFPGLQNMFDTFSPAINIYHPVTWVERGILRNLAVDRTEHIVEFGKPKSVLNSGAFRMSVTGPITPIDDMITTTKRGLLVTRFSDSFLLDFESQLYRGYTRDGVWLIENGKVTRAVKNLAFTESPLFVLNNVEQLGAPQRVFHPTQSFQWWSIPQPVIVPSLKVRDFSFTALADAV